MSVLPLVFALTPLAQAGYGDAVDGYPTADEREMHFWTDAVRVDPEAFSDAYVGCRFNDFKDNEKTPKLPLHWNIELNEAARFHSGHMVEWGYFDHDTPNNDSIGDEWRGVSFFERLEAFYSGGMVGENIAQGYGSPYSVVLEGWMCSSGHRENIMRDAFTEYGGGIDGVTYTQNFGASGVSHALTNGVHWGNSGEVEFGVAFHDGSSPARVAVVVDGVGKALDLSYGADNQGIYMGTMALESGCHRYFFEADVGGATVRFPEDGAFGFGACTFDDEAAEWFASRGEAVPVSTGEGGEGGEGSLTPRGWGIGPAGCSTAPAPTSLAGLGGLAVLGLLRRRKA